MKEDKKKSEENEYKCVLKSFPTPSFLFSSHYIASTFIAIVENSKFA